MAARFSLPQGRKNQMIVFLFFYIKFRFLILKENNLLRKKKIGLGTRISLLPR